ncbi:MAG: single-stranded-DNA-specific exonuclease RecJ, partial [Clostridia bacterium]|nr:single-stranded-DNA-specific exonuclease RecJ [Clostridia bacterium]
SRLTKKYNKPCILISPGADGLYKGSGRSLTGFSLYDALTACSEHLDRFGGHELAAGLVIEEKKVDIFRKAINDYAFSVLHGEPLLPVEEVDLELRGRHLNLECAKELLALEPFGSGNKSPLFIIKDMYVNRISTLGAEGQHLKMQFIKDGCAIDAIAFSFADKIHLTYGSTVTVLAHLEVNSFRGTESAQLKITDMEVR